MVELFVEVLDSVPDGEAVGQCAEPRYGLQRQAGLLSRQARVEVPDLQRHLYVKVLLLCSSLIHPPRYFVFFRHVLQQQIRPPLFRVCVQVVAGRHHHWERGF